MSASSTRQHGLRDALLLLLPLTMLALGVLRSGGVREMATVARESRDLVRTRSEFYRAQTVLGADYALVRRLQEDHPPGTPVSVRGRGASLGRSQRFWLALLPAYPVRADARLVICAEPCAGEGDRVLARGDLFVLLERGDTR